MVKGFSSRKYKLGGGDTDRDGRGVDNLAVVVPSKPPAIAKHQQHGPGERNGAAVVMTGTGTGVAGPGGGRGPPSGAGSGSAAARAGPEPERPADGGLKAACTSSSLDGSDSTSGISVDLEGVTASNSKSCTASTTPAPAAGVETQADSLPSSREVVHVDAVLVPGAGGSTIIKLDAQEIEDDIEVQGATGGMVVPLADCRRNESSISMLTIDSATGVAAPRCGPMNGALCGLGRSLEEVIGSHRSPPEPVHHAGGDPNGRFW